MPVIGQTVSHYRITEKLGEGGMGVVYRAEDTNLDRQVAIKLLPDHFSGNPERLARFEREAKLLASLNHPNIATIHGLEEAEGKRFLVLELVEGETLSERIAKGPLPVDEALEVCKQIAEGLEAAHEKGVIHRDLKPANIKVTPEGKIKILDFGLAKAFQEEAAAADLSQSPTPTAAMTRAGVILGTAAYMSPEQAKGKAVDKRTDIWAFGCILYECLTGRRAFEGETVTEALAAVLTRDPLWDSLPPATPSLIRNLLRRCLERNSPNRLRDIGEARIDIRKAIDGGGEPEHESFASMDERKSGITWTAVTGIGLAAIIIGVTATLLWLRVFPPSPGSEPAGQKLIKRFSIPLPEGQVPTMEAAPLILSPNGNILALSAEGEKGDRLYVWDMENPGWSPLQGTEGARSPCFDPDGEWLAFDSGAGFNKLSLLGGTPIPMYQQAGQAGAGGWSGRFSWSLDNFLIWGSYQKPELLRAPVTSGQPLPVLKKSAGQGELNYVHPQILPGGTKVLFIVTTGRGAETRVVSLETGNWTRILDYGAEDVTFASTGHLLFCRKRSLWAVPFDSESLSVSQEKPVLEGIRTDQVGGIFTVSPDGTLAYCPSDVEDSLVWVSRDDGTETPLPVERGLYMWPRISPGGNSILVSDDSRLLVLDSDRGNPAPLVEKVRGPALWSQDGEKVAYFQFRTGLFVMPSNRSAPATQILYTGGFGFCTSWSPNGQSILMMVDALGWNIDMIPLEANGKRQTKLGNNWSESALVFSPDGHWIAYVSDESKQKEVMIMDYAGVGGSQKVSAGGGTEPVWSKNQNRLELFYRNGDRMMAVTVPSDPSLKPEKPTELFRGSYKHVGEWPANYDVDNSGERFLMVKERPAKEIVIVLNWFEELRQKFAAGK